MSTRENSPQCGERLMLMDLPWECIQIIVETLARSYMEKLGVRKFVRLRLVNKFFAESVLISLGVPGIINISKFLEDGQPPFPKQIMTRVLLGRLSQPSSSRSKFFLAVNQVVNFLAQNLDRPDETQRLKYAEALCSADISHPIDQHLVQNSKQCFLLKDTDPDLKRQDFLYRHDIEPITASTNALVAAACLGDVDLLRKLIFHGADINAHSDFFRPPLEQAASRGHYDAVHLLLEAGADPNFYESQNAWNGSRTNRKAALCKACRGGHGRVVFLLLDGKYGLKQRKAVIRPAILEAVRGGHEKLVKDLLDYCAYEGEYLFKLREAIFLDAVKNGSDKIVRRMLTEDVRLGKIQRLDKLHKVSGYDRSGKAYKTCLEWAALSGNCSVVKMLLEHGASREDSSLGQAARNGHVDAALLLLKYPGDVNIQVMLNGSLHPVRDHLSMTPLMIAARNSHHSMAKFLIKWGARVENTSRVLAHTKEALIFAHGNRTIGQGTTALTFAIENDDYDMVKLLLEAGASPNGPEWQSWNHTSDQELIPHGRPVESAMSINPRIVDLLLQFGAHPFEPGKSWKCK
ncbi:ankyrin repeat-containing domain protein [Bisporella sp. PMI_857]|nr:ankyrin repeat-containing domain protein [Bisporella sp. PMI_857]